MLTESKVDRKKLESHQNILKFRFNKKLVKFQGEIIIFLRILVGCPNFFDTHYLDVDSITNQEQKFFPRSLLEFLEHLLGKVCVGIDLVQEWVAVELESLRLVWDAGFGVAHENNWFYLLALFHKIPVWIVSINCGMNSGKNFQIPVIN